MLACLLGPGWGDLEEFEDAALGVGEAVEFDAGVGVGEAESLEDAEDVASGGFGGAVLGQQAGDEFVFGERFAESVSISPKIRSAIPMMLVSA